MPVKDESCISCGAEGTAPHPWVAIMNVSELAPDRVPLETNGEWAAVPICVPCHMHPDKRPVPVKAHFFARVHMEAAVGAAGSDTLGG